jgi:phosphate starvation-inducible PhoH-like protein
MTKKQSHATELSTIVDSNKTIYVYQKEKLTRPISIRELPWTQKQLDFIDLALDKKTKIMLVKGPAGTSKTLLSVYTALKLLNTHKVSDIIFLRSPVESSDSKLGFLPGTAEEKMEEYLIPFSDKLDELLSEADQKYLMVDNRITCIPVGFMRGRHLSVKAVILDEAQNCTFPELTTITTRLGYFSKLFILGDPTQSDLTNGKRDGFNKFYDLFNDEESREHGIFIFEFGIDDILRSDLVKYIVRKIAMTHNHPHQ